MTAGPPSDHLWRALTSTGSTRVADSSPRDTYGLGRRPALREPCRPSAPGCLELVRQGKVILAASTFRRLKMRWDPCSGTSITAQSRCSSRSLPPLMAHKRHRGAGAEHPDCGPFGENSPFSEAKLLVREGSPILSAIFSMRHPRKRRA